MANQLSRYEKIFIKIVKIYVKHCPVKAFAFTFDDSAYSKIGVSEQVIKVQFLDSKNTFKRIFTAGSLGLGEVYCEGKIKVADEDYKYFFMIFVKISSRIKLLGQLPLWDIFYILKAKLTNPQVSLGSQHQDINSHYSLSHWFASDDDANQFYLYWLNSPYIQYSCGKWDEDTKTLDEAQVNKFEFYAQRLGLTKEASDKYLLDLGCGWGGLMFYLAEKYGVNCTGLTLSTAQVKYVGQEIARRNLGDKVQVKYQNIHDLSGQWDYIVSVGVLEHITDYDDLYKKTAAALKTGGRALFHTMYHNHYFHKTDAFLAKYIFPGGEIPNVKSNQKVFKEYFKHVDRNDLPRCSYPKTLDCWFKNFCHHEPAIRQWLREKSRCPDIDYSVRVFKHYLTLAYCGLTNEAIVSNTLVYN